MNNNKQSIKSELLKKLRTDYLHDYIVFREQFGEIKSYYIFDVFKDAKKKHDQLINSMLGDDKTNIFYVEQIKSHKEIKPLKAEICLLTGIPYIRMGIILR
jgi:hypothetical protein